MRNQYYECHITLEEKPSNRYKVFEAVESFNWKFSAIDGDPVLGNGIKMYATKHFNAKLTEESVLEKLNWVTGSLSQMGFKVVRSKIELVIHDEIRRSGKWVI